MKSIGTNGHELRAKFVPASIWQSGMGVDRALRTDQHPLGEIAGPAAAIAEFWARVAIDQGAWTAAQAGYDALLDEAAFATTTEVLRTLDWLEKAIEQCDRPAAIAAARYLGLMPEPVLASAFDRLQGLFNRRALGMVWQLGPELDMASLPLLTPLFDTEASFGLIRAVPRLYEKLALLHPELEDMVIDLAREARQHHVRLTPALLEMVIPPTAIG